MRSLSSRVIFLRPAKPFLLDSIGPVKSETQAVPADDRFGGDQEQRALPPRPKPPDQHPEQFVTRPELWAFALGLQHGKLLTQDKIFPSRGVGENETVVETHRAEAAADYA